MRDDRLPTPPESPAPFGDPTQDAIAAVWRRHIDASEPATPDSPDAARQRRTEALSATRRRMTGGWR